jgi:2-polyprenyl-3-methyl-5-hydroxy-6-metoxy-1,4-benzoquinol methylase
LHVQSTAPLHIDDSHDSDDINDFDDTDTSEDARSLHSRPEWEILMSSELNSRTRQSFNVVDRFIRSFRTRRIRACLKPTDVVLDFGCGQENWFLRSSVKSIAGGVGIDPNLNPSFDQVLPQETVQARRCTLEEFANSTSTRFDVITWIAVIEHFHSSDAEAFLLACIPLLKPGGKILLTTPTPRSKPILELLAYKLSLISEDEIRDHKVYYDRSKMESILKRSKLSMETYKTFQFSLNSLVIAIPIAPHKEEQSNER